MRIDFKGRLADEQEITAAFIGCGSHSFRDLCPTFQFAPVNLVAVCDLDARKAEAFAAKFGAKSAYSDHHRMLADKDLDAVFICTGYDESGFLRPLPRGRVDRYRSNQVIQTRNRAHEIPTKDKKRIGSKTIAEDWGTLTIVPG